MSSDKLRDFASERAVIVGVLNYGLDCYLDVSDILQVDSFMDETNQALYICIQKLYEEREFKKIDQPSLMAVADELGYKWLFEKPDDIKYVKGLFGAHIKLENIRTWAAKIRKLQIARLLQEQLQGAVSSLDEIKGSEPIEEILGIGETAIFDFTSLLQNEGDAEPQLLSSGISEYIEEIENNPRDIIGVSSGYSYYDQSIGGGFRRKTVSMVGSRTKGGKSFLSLNIGLHVSRILKIPVLYLDTEMNIQDHQMRILPNMMSRLYNIQLPITDLETGHYINNNFFKGKIKESAEELKKYPFYYKNISGKPFEETLSIIRRWLHKTVGYNEDGVMNNCLIIYDYIKLMSGDALNHNLAEYQQLGFMMTSLHNFAVKYDVPIFTLIQLNRDGIDLESTAAVSGSDRITWLVTNFSIFKIKTDEEIAENPTSGNRKMVPIMARHGEGLEPNDYINMNFIKKLGRIDEGETRNNLKKKHDHPEPPVGDIPFGADDDKQVPQENTDSNEGNSDNKPD